MKKDRTSGIAAMAKSAAGLVTRNFGLKLLSLVIALVIYAVLLPEAQNQPPLPAVDNTATAIVRAVVQSEQPPEPKQEPEPRQEPKTEPKPEPAAISTNTVTSTATNADAERQQN